MYITYLNPPKTRQITFDEILAGVQNVEALHYGGSNTSTMTVCRNDLTAKLRAITNVPEMIEKLAAYNLNPAISRVTTLTLRFQRNLAAGDPLMRPMKLFLMH